MSITVTQKAAKEILRVVQEQNLSTDDTVLRLGVQDAGYSMSFGKKNEVNLLGDILYSFDGLGVVVERKVDGQLDGMTVDFYEDKNRRGFVFNAPTQPLRVGMSCGSSAPKDGGCGGCGGGCG